MPDLRNALLWARVETQLAKFCEYGEVPVWVKMAGGRATHAELRIGTLTVSIHGERSAGGVLATPSSKEVL